MSAWIATTERMPDDDEAVLIALADGEVWTGFHDGDHGWRFVSADLVGSEVRYWMQFPEPPARISVTGPNVDEVADGDVRTCLRNLIATIDLQTDCMTNTIDRAALDPHIERAEDLLGETLEEIVT